MLSPGENESFDLPLLRCGSLPSHAAVEAVISSLHSGHQGKLTFGTFLSNVFHPSNDFSLCGHSHLAL